MTKLMKIKLKSLFIRNKGFSEDKHKPVGTRLVYKENEVSLNFSSLSLLEEKKKKASNQYIQKLKNRDASKCLSSNKFFPFLPNEA